MALCRGYALVEVITAMALAVSLVIGFGMVMRSQVLEVRTTSDSLRAREALVAASDRLHAGSIPIPPALQSGQSEAPLEVQQAPPHIRLTTQRAAKVDPRLVHPHLVAVVLRASWTGPGGQERERTLTVLVERKADR